MKMALGTLPPSLPDAYVDIINRIKAKGDESYNLAVKILSWINYATVPLSMRQVQEALTIDEDDHIEEEDILQSESIVNVCGSLLAHDQASGIVRFTHYTVQEFLRSKYSHELVPVVDLGKKCLTCLNFKEFESGPCQDAEALKQRIKKTEFCTYAAQAWGSYIRGDGEEDDGVVQNVRKLLTSENRTNTMLQLENLRDPNAPFGGYIKSQTALHVLAKIGLATICQKMLQDATVVCGTCEDRWRFDVQAVDGKGRTPLYEAAFNGHHEMVLILLKFGADPAARDVFNRTALHRAAKNGHDEVVKCLLTFKPELAQAKDCHEWTPLTLALHNGRTETSKLLLHACGVTIPEITGDNAAQTHLNLCLALTKLYPDDHTFHHTAANCYWNLKMYSEAEKHYDAALRLFPANRGVTDVSSLIQTNFCDHCDKTIKGRRYKCKACGDYDLCEKCFAIEPKLHIIHEIISLPSGDWANKSIQA